MEPKLHHLYFGSAAASKHVIISDTFPKCVLTLYTSADVVDLKRCQEIVSLKVSTS